MVATKRPAAGTELVGLWPMALVGEDGAPKLHYEMVYLPFSFEQRHVCVGDWQPLWLRAQMTKTTTGGPICNFSSREYKLKDLAEALLDSYVFSPDIVASRHHSFLSC